MAYCGPQGIPLSVFLSWSRQDQEAALAWQQYEARRCGSCGSHPDEGDHHVHTDVCPGCVQLQRARDSDDAKVPGAHTHLTHGTTSDCARCMAEIEANRRR